MQETNQFGIKKVVIIGPECTGKSELSEYLAGHFKTQWVPEYARAYLDNLNRPYTEPDLISIAEGQLKLEDELSAKARDVVICDTNLMVIKVWSNFKYGRCADEILELIRSRTYDLYLLTYIDIPWQADPQREHPEERDVLWNIYYNELQNQNVPMVEIRGDRAHRRVTAINAITNLLRPNE